MREDEKAVYYGETSRNVYTRLTLVYLLKVPPRIEVPLGKIADFKRVKMVNTS